VSADASPTAPSTGPVLAIDYGQARLGLAVCDPSRKFVFGRPTLERSSEDRDCAALGALCREDAIVLVVVGLPINADGSEGGAAKAARTWASKLSERLGLPVVLVDERYTTIEADEALRLQHRDWRERRKKIDKAAATLILQTFLDHGPHRS
jgi:putative Holliday junction resolvase